MTRLSTCIVLSLAASLAGGAAAALPAHSVPVIERPQGEAGLAPAAPQGPVKDAELVAAPHAKNKGAVPRTQAPTATVPEPSTFIMLVMGLLVLGHRARRAESFEPFKS